MGMVRSSILVRPLMFVKEFLHIKLIFPTILIVESTPLGEDPNL